MPTPAAKDLQTLVEAAADNRRLRKQLEALREAELELAAREAEETALNFSMLVGSRGKVMLVIQVPIKQTGNTSLSREGIPRHAL